MGSRSSKIALRRMVQLTEDGQLDAWAMLLHSPFVRTRSCRPAGRAACAQPMMMIYGNGRGVSKITARVMTLLMSSKRLQGSVGCTILSARIGVLPKSRQRSDAVYLRN